MSEQQERSLIDSHGAVIRNAEVGKHGSWNVWLVLGLWQVLSLLLTTQGVFNQLISQTSNVPTAQIFSMYLCLLLIYFVPFARRRLPLFGGQYLSPTSSDPIDACRYVLLSKSITAHASHFILQLIDAS